MMGNPAIFPLALIAMSMLTFCNGKTLYGIFSLSSRGFLSRVEGTFDNSEELHFDRIGIVRLAARKGTFKGLSAVKKMSITHNTNFGGLKAGAFAGLSGMTELDLRHNRLYALLPGVFNGLSSLVILQLQHSAISYFQAGVLKDLPALRAVHLDHNPCPLSSRVFEGLPSLHLVSLKRTSVRSIPSDAFHKSTMLRTLRLDNNQIAAQDGMFNSLSVLHALTLANDRFVSLPAGAFQGLTELKSLNLSANRLQRLPAGIFNDLSKLEILDISGNNIYRFPRGTWNHLPNLRQLSARGLSNNPEAYCPFVAHSKKMSSFQFIKEFSFSEDLNYFQEVCKGNSILSCVDDDDMYSHVCQCGDGFQYNGQTCVPTAQCTSDIYCKSYPTCIGNGPDVQCYCPKNGNGTMNTDGCNIFMADDQLLLALQNNIQAMTTTQSPLIFEAEGEVEDLAARHQAMSKTRSLLTIHAKNNIKSSSNGGGGAQHSVEQFSIQRSTHTSSTNSIASTFSLTACILCSLLSMLYCNA